MGLCCRRAVSPVIASVLLVAVAVMIAVGVSFWMSGISSQYTLFETMEITTAYSMVETNVTNAQWKIVLGIKNSGSAGATLKEVFVNRVPVNDYGVSSGGSLTDASSTGTSISTNGATLKSGERKVFYVWIGSGLMSSGTSCEIKIHSAAGMDYVILIKLA